MVKKKRTAALAIGATAYQPLVEEESDRFSVRGQPSAPAFTVGFDDIEADYDSFDDDDDDSAGPGEPVPRSLVVPSLLPPAAVSGSVPPGTVLAHAPQHAVVGARVVRAPGKKARERVKSNVVASAPPAITAARVVAAGLPVAAGGGPRVVAARIITPGTMSSAASPVVASRVVTPGTAVSPTVISARVVTPGAIHSVTSSSAAVGQPLPQMHTGPVVISAKVIRAGTGPA
jgi:hypothetical protein